MTTRLSSLIDDIEACFDSLSLTTSGPDELRQKLAALRKAVALPADTAVVGEGAGWLVEAAAKAKADPYVDDGEDITIVARGRKITDAVLTASSYRNAYLAAERLLELYGDYNVNGYATPSPTGGREAGLEEAAQHFEKLAAEAAGELYATTASKQTIFNEAAKIVRALLPSEQKAGS